MPIAKIEKFNCKLSTIYESILDDLNKRIEIEENKYPLTEREKMFADTLRELLTALDHSHRMW